MAFAPGQRYLAAGLLDGSVRVLSGDGKTVIEIVSFSGKSRIGNYSGTRMRNFAKDNNFEGFYDDLPDAINKKEAQEMFSKVKIGLGV